MGRIFALLTVSALWLAQANAQAAGDLVLNVTLDYDQERDHVATQAVFNDLARYLSGALGRRVKLVMTQNAERVGERIRTDSYAMLLAPAQLVGLAMRHGYEPVARTGTGASVVLIARRGSGVRSLAQAKGKRLVLPHRESLVSYMVRGELNAKGLSPASHFGQVAYMNKYGAVLYAMDIGQADLVAVKESTAGDWLRSHAGAEVIETYPRVPLAGVAVSGNLDAALKDRVRTAFTGMDAALQARLGRAQMGSFEAAGKADFEYVSTRGFYTPEVLTGATVVAAGQVKKLMDEGVPLFDVRPQAHYREGHIPKATNVPYQMNSPKETDYDDGVDRFDTARLPGDKNAPMIFQCNGAECWYSYKAARYMIKRGYTKIYWFRTGLPAWKAAGYPIRQGT